MSILIRGREMPENCQECVCLNDEYFYCQAVGRQPQDENIVSRRPDWCPLIEVSDDKIVLTRDEFAFYSRCMLMETMTKFITVKSFSEKHGVPVNIVKLFLRRIHINAEENTMINEEALATLLRSFSEGGNK